MHVQIVTFNLDGIGEGEYIDIATRLAPRFAGLPGLLAKVWLESPASRTYGAIYFWDDEESMNRFLATDLFEGTNPDFVNLTVDDFSVLANLTRATQPVLTVLDDAAPRGQAAAPPPPARAAQIRTRAKAPAANAPLAGAVAKKAPAARAPVAKAPARKAAAGRAAGGKAPAGKAPMSRVTKVAPAPAKAAARSSRARKPAP